MAARRSALKRPSTTPPHNIEMPHTKSCCFGVNNRSRKANHGATHHDIDRGCSLLPSCCPWYPCQSLRAGKCAAGIDRAGPTDSWLALNNEGSPQDTHTCSIRPVFFQIHHMAPANIERNHRRHASNDINDCWPDARKAVSIKCR